MSLQPPKPPTEPVVQPTYSPGRIEYVVGAPPSKERVAALAFEQVCKALEPLDDEYRTRVLRAVSVIYNLNA